MKIYLVFGIFLFISQRKKTTARDIADMFEISTRTVYRYIDCLCMANVPIVCERGKNGGISLANNFSLESLVLSKNEKDTLKCALNQIPLNVKIILEKICA